MKKINTNSTFLSLAFCMVAAVIIFSSCGKSDPNSPGIEYMPDMYRSPSHEANLTTTFGDDTIQVDRMPVNGTIPRGFIPYAYGNDTGGYANAGRYLKNPIAFNEDVLKEGEVLYTKYCVHCHGGEGKGDGAVAAKLPGPPPSYSSPALANLPEGKVFHTITYGKGMMGPHASQLTQEERWKVVHFVQKLQKLGAPAPTKAATADSTATASAK